MGGNTKLPKIVGIISSLELLIKGNLINEKKAYNIGIIIK
jgi:hypothetical protein